jgi:hypothetical protein
MSLLLRRVATAAARVPLRMQTNNMQPLLRSRHLHHRTALVLNQGDVNASSSPVPPSADAAASAVPTPTSSQPMTRAERLKRMQERRDAGGGVGGVRSHVPRDADAVTPEAQQRAAEEQEAAREQRREARRRDVMEHDERRRVVRVAQDKEPWPDQLIMAECETVLRRGREALANLVQSGQFRLEEHVDDPEAAPAAPNGGDAAAAAAAAASASASATTTSAARSRSIRPLAEFIFPSLNSFQRWKVHMIAGTLSGEHEELSHEAAEIMGGGGGAGKKLLALKYRVPKSEEGRRAAIEALKAPQATAQATTPENASATEGTKPAA